VVLELSKFVFRITDLKCMVRITYSPPICDKCQIGYFGCLVINMIRLDIPAKSGCKKYDISVNFLLVAKIGLDRLFLSSKGAISVKR
jgi:hypothetical protein